MGMKGTKIGVKNFRIFKNRVDFQLGKMTVFTGPNNSGKSTLSQFLLFLKASFKFNFDPINHITASGKSHLVMTEKKAKDLGSFRSNLNKDMKDQPMELSFSSFDEKGNETKVFCEYTYQNGVPLTNLLVQINNETMFELTRKTLEEGFGLNAYAYSSDFESQEWEHGSNAWFWELQTLDEGLWYDHFLKNSRMPYFGAQIVEYMDLTVEELAEKGLKQIDFAYFVPISYDENRPALFELDCYNLSGVEVGTIMDFERKLIMQIIKAHFDELFEREEFSDDRIKEEASSKKSINTIYWAIRDFERERKYNVQELMDLQHYGKIENLKYKTYSEFKTKSYDEIFKFNALDLSSVVEVISKINNPLSEFAINELLKNSKSKPVKHRSSGLSMEYWERMEEFVLNEIGNLQGTPERVLAECLYNVEIGFSQQQQIESGYLFHKNHGSLKLFGQNILNKIGSLKGDETYLIKKYFDEINHWLPMFSSNTEMTLSPITQNGEYIGFSYSLEKEGALVPVVNEGLGMQKLISLLVLLYETNGALIIEEPEANLHPALQSKLAQLFASAIEKSFKTLIIETHSEYLIRKLQYLIADPDSKLTTDDVAIYYCHDPNNVPPGEDQVYQLKIREDGFMENDFGPGFFDEASNLSIGLMKFNSLN